MTALITLNILASIALLVTIPLLVRLRRLDRAMDAVIDWFQEINEHT
jgi:hypothetical protein